MSRANVARLGLLCTAACTGDPGAPALGATTLATYSTCAALEADLKELLLQELAAGFDRQRHGLGAAQTPGPPRVEGADYSDTDVPEAGADEADLVKTDGHDLYLLDGDRLHVFGVPQPGALVPEAVVPVEGWPTEMLLAGGRVAVLSRVDVASLPAGHPLRAAVTTMEPGGALGVRVAQVSKITVLDAGDPRRPRVVRELYLEGSYQTARLVGGSVRVASYSWMALPALGFGSAPTSVGPQLTLDQREAAARAALDGLALADLVPRLYERQADGRYAPRELTAGDCGAFHRPGDSHGRGVTTIVTIDLDHPDRAIDADAVISNPATIYASTDRLYVVERANDDWWSWYDPTAADWTNLHAFDLSTAGRTPYVGSGRVEGQVHDRFALSEADGDLRVATTTDRAPAPESHLWVLAPGGGRLTRVGHLGGIAPGEPNAAARFAGATALVETARPGDPVLTFDLSDPTAPRAVGEVAVPGLSTSFQDLGGGRLLAIGWTQVALLDVTDGARPEPVETQVLAGGAGSTAGPRAFQYLAAKDLLAVPVSSAGLASGAWSTSSHLELLSVTAAGLRRYGDIDHSGFYNSDPTRPWTFTDVRRSLLLGEFIYAISDRGVSVHRLADLGLVTSAELPGYVPGVAYWE